MAGQTARRYREKECRWCGKAFLPKQAGSKTCSVPCQRADRNSRKQKGALTQMQVAATEIENDQDDLSDEELAAHESLVAQAERAYAEALKEGRAITPQTEAELMFAKLRRNEDEVPGTSAAELPTYLNATLDLEDLGVRRARTRKRMAIRLGMLHPFDVPVFLSA